MTTTMTQTDHIRTARMGSVVRQLTQDVEISHNGVAIDLSRVSVMRDGEEIDSCLIDGLALHNWGKPSNRHFQKTIFLPNMINKHAMALMMGEASLRVEHFRYLGPDIEGPYPARGVGYEKILTVYE